MGTGRPILKRSNRVGAGAAASSIARAAAARRRLSGTPFSPAAAATTTSTDSSHPSLTSPTGDMHSRSPGRAPVVAPLSIDASAPICAFGHLCRISREWRRSARESAATHFAPVRSQRAPPSSARSSSSSLCERIYLHSTRRICKRFIYGPERSALNASATAMTRSWGWSRSGFDKTVGRHRET